MTEVETAIKDEMRQALAKLGAKPKTLARVEAEDRLDAPLLYRAAEDLGADRVLLAIIGSRGDTMSDEAVLAGLRNWNAGKPFFDKLIASVDHPLAEQGPPKPRRSSKGTKRKGRTAKRRRG